MNILHLVTFLLLWSSITTIQEKLSSRLAQPPPPPGGSTPPPPPPDGSSPDPNRVLRPLNGHWEGFGYQLFHQSTFDSNFNPPGFSEFDMSPVNAN